MINMTTEEFKTALYALVDDEHTVITNSAISDGISLIDGKINVHNVKITSEHFIFGDGSNKTRLITYADLTGLDVSSVTDLSSCFSDYGGLSLGLDISNWNTSNVTNMAYMFFRYCGTSLDLSGLDTSNVISMSSMFDGCTANVLNLSSFDTSSVTDDTDMFLDCTTTRIVVDVDKWTLDTSSGVFYNYNGKVYIGDTEIMTKANSDRDIATSLNSALAEYDNNVIKANYYDKTEINTTRPKFVDWSNCVVINGFSNNSEKTYTCPDDGFIICNIIKGGNTASAYIKINNVVIANPVGYANASSQSINMSFYVNKNDVVKCKSSLTEGGELASSSFIKFFYLKSL